MRLSLFYNPLVIIDRLAIAINRNKRKKKLQGSPAAHLGLGYIDSLELLELMKKDGHHAECIFDIGANIGTWTLLAKSFFPDAAVKAFEPLDIHIQKFRQITGKLSNVEIHDYCLGSKNEASVMNVSSFSDSSSLLEATSLEYEQFRIKKAGEQQVQIKRLDTLIDAGSLPIPDVMKLDVQGYELEVLKGMGHYLDAVKYLIIEVSFKEYYHGQASFLDIANYLADFKFKTYAFGTATPLGTELGQIDVLFKKKFNTLS